MRFLLPIALLCSFAGASTLSAQSGLYATGQDEDAARQEALLLGSAGISLDSGAIQERLLVQQATIQSLTESLAAANEHSRELEREAGDLRLKLNTLGVASLSGNEAALEQKLLAAVRELRGAQSEIAALRNMVAGMSESILMLLQAAPNIDPATRMSIESQLRAASLSMNISPEAVDAEPVKKSLTDGIVVDVKPELSLVVANLGERDGVRIGMPFQVLRNNKKIGTVRVVDVRSRISGAILQELEPNETDVRTGDSLRVDARM